MKDVDEGVSGRLLVHVCCATCYLGIAQDLAGRGLEFEGYFFNPNVHPLLEFRKRLKAGRVLAHDAKLAISFEEEYGLVEWLRAVVGREDERCEVCYRMRLERTAREAHARGFAGFTTTLLASPHQKHDRVRQLGDEAGRKFAVEFVYHDWRSTHESGCEEARRRSLYRQQYCGCIYSESERYEATGKELWQGGRDQKS